MVALLLLIVLHVLLVIFAVLLVWAHFPPNYVAPAIIVRVMSAFQTRRNSFARRGLNAQLARLLPRHAKQEESTSWRLEHPLAIRALQDSSACLPIRNRIAALLVLHVRLEHSPSHVLPVHTRIKLG